MEHQQIFALFALFLVAACSDAIPIEDDASFDSLNRFYNEMAHPRQRRVQNMASALEKLSQIKNYYNEAGRPRFGKRSGEYYPPAVEAVYPVYRDYVMAK